MDKNLLELLKKFKGKTAQDLSQHLLGTLKVTYSTNGRTRGGESDLETMFHYVNRPGYVIWIKGDDFITLDGNNFWNTVVNRLEEILKNNPQAPGRVPVIKVTAHKMVAVGWKDRAPSLHCWFELRDGGEQIFCDPNGFEELCQSIGVKVVNEDADDEIPAEPSP